jgi:N-methylhydantoinase B
LGVELKYRALEKSTVNVMLERILEPPWGTNGGHDGRSNAATLSSSGTERPVTKESNIALSPGDTVVFRTAGGGGYGDPSLRDPQEILEDLRQGYITPAQAQADYGHSGVFTNQEVNP